MLKRLYQLEEKVCLFFNDFHMVNPLFISNDVKDNVQLNALLSGLQFASR
jgi:hypothetical protein